MNNEEFWKHVKECGMLIDAIKDVIQESPKKEVIRIKVKALSTQFISTTVSYNASISIIILYRHGVKNVKYLKKLLIVML